MKKINKFSSLMPFVYIGGGGMKIFGRFFPSTVRESVRSHARREGKGLKNGRGILENKSNFLILIFKMLFLHFELFCIFIFRLDEVLIVCERKSIASPFFLKENDKIIINY